MVIDDYSDRMMSLEASMVERKYFENRLRRSNMKGVGIPENLEGSDQINSFLRRFGESISFFHVPSEHNGQQYFCFSFIPSRINIAF